MKLRLKKVKDRYSKLFLKNNNISIDPSYFYGDKNNTFQGQRLHLDNFGKDLDLYRSKNHTRNGIRIKI